MRMSQLRGRQGALPTLKVRRKGTVFYAGDPAQSVLRLKEGLLRVARLDSEGRVLTLNHVLPGDVFGEEALASGVRNCSVEALTEALVEIVGPELLDMGDLHAVVCSLASQIGRLATFECHLQTGSLRERVARYLLFLLHTPLASRQPSGLLVIYATHELLAEGTASTRESVSKVMAELRGDNLVETGYCAVTLRDVAALAHEAGWMDGMWGAMRGEFHRAPLQKVSSAFTLLDGRGLPRRRFAGAL